MLAAAAASPLAAVESPPAAAEKVPPHNFAAAAGTTVKMGQLVRGEENSLLREAHSLPAAAETAAAYSPGAAGSHFAKEFDQHYPHSSFAVSRWVSPWLINCTNFRNICHSRSRHFWIPRPYVVAELAYRELEREKTN